MSNLIKILKELNNSDESLKNVSIDFKDITIISYFGEFDPINRVQQYVEDVFLNESEIAESIANDIQGMVNGNRVLIMNNLQHEVVELSNIRGTKIFLDFSNGKLTANLNIKTTNLGDIFDHLNFFTGLFKNNCIEFRSTL